MNAYGFVRRARFCYLYTQSGIRLTDLCQAGGRAILGWNCGSANTAFKNVFNRGVHVGAPWIPAATGTTGTPDTAVTEEEHRLYRAVRALFPGVSNVSLVRADTVPDGFPQWRPWAVDTAGTAIRILEKTTDHTDLTDRLTDGTYDFRPSLSSLSVLSVRSVVKSRIAAAGTVDADTASEALFFLPPFPLAGDWAVVTYAGRRLEFVAQTSSVPPCILAGITRSIYDLIAELPRRGEAGWARYDKYLSPFFERRGPYLYPKMSESDYPAFAARCLAAHLVISPLYGVPSIIPWGANPGDFTLLIRNGHGN